GQRRAGIRARAERHLYRLLTEQWHLVPQGPGQAGGNRGAAATAEHLDQLAAVRTGQSGHVLDHPGDLLLGLRRDRTGALGYLGGGHLRCGDDQEFRAGHQLRYRNRDVTGARGQVEEQYVQVTPVDVGEELFERTVQHWSPPAPRPVAAGEHADRDHPDSVCHRWHDHVLDLGGQPGDPEHPWYGVPVDVRVHDADRETGCGNRGGQVHRYRGLANPALAGRDRVDPGHRGCLGERDVPAGLGAAQLGLQRLALLLGHYPERDLHPGDSVDPAYRIGDVAGQRLLERAARH